MIGVGAIVKPRVRACMARVLAALVCLGIFGATEAYGQTLDYADQVGLPGNDHGYDIAVDDDGNTYVVGSLDPGRDPPPSEHATTYGGSDVFVQKRDRAGRVLWTRMEGGEASDVGRGIAVDGDGNVLITGWFVGTAVFGRDEPNETELVSTALGEIFVAKYDPEGRLLWAKQTGGSNARPVSDQANAIAVDALGNAYVAGSFNGGSVFGPGEPGETTLSSSRIEAFLAKYGPDGALLWARQAQGAIDDFGNGVAVDRDGHAYVTGTFRRRTTFGSVTLTTQGVEAMFLAKYAPDGSVLWARAGQTDLAGAAYGATVAVDRQGGCVVAGSFGGTLRLGAGTPDDDLSLTDGTEFLARYDAAGTPRWAKRMRGPTPLSSLADLSTDRHGDVHLTGTFEGTLTLGVGEPGEKALSARSPDISDGFLARFDEAGTLRGALSFGGEGADRGLGVAADPWGRSLVTGGFSESAQFGERTLVSVGYEDLFVAAYGSTALSLELVVQRGEWIETLRDVQASQSQLVLQNGSPGLIALWAFVNGHLRALAPLRSGARYTLDLSRLLRQGEGNTVVLVAFGARGARASLTLGSPIAPP